MSDSSLNKAELSTSALSNADTLAIAQALIARESVTPNDSGCQQLMADFLTPLGFVNEKMNFDDTQNIWCFRQGSTNLTAANSAKQKAPIVPKADSPCFVFAGHTDVVPAGNLSQWQFPPFEPTIKDGFLYGRGAADMKGSLAAMLTATRQFVQDYPSHSGSIAFLITSDEEGPFINGTVKVVETLQQRNQAIDYCIVGEPSSTETLGDVIKIGRRGSLTCWLTIKGTQGHVAYPHLADNAIHKASEFVTQLSQIEWDKGNQYFPATSLQVTHFTSGEAGNVIPGEAGVEFNFRFSTEQSHQSLQEKIIALLHQNQIEFDIKWKLNGEPFITQSSELIDAVSGAIKQIKNIQTSAQTSGGTSDGRFIAKTGAQIVEIGPVNKTIHQINECVKISDLEQLSQIYYLSLKAILVDAK
jgi:succinyl-diaminopimelate desuccinylase